MASGAPGDHPVSDILNYDLQVFSKEIDDLVRKIAKYYPRERLWDLYPWFSPPPLPEFEAELRAKLAELEDAARERGWEPKD